MLFILTALLLNPLTHATTHLYRGVNQHGDCFVELKINDIYPLRIDSTRYAGGVKTAYRDVLINGFYHYANSNVVGNVNEPFAPRRAFLGGFEAELRPGAGKIMGREYLTIKKIHISPTLHSPHTITFTDSKSGFLGILDREVKSATCTNLMPLEGQNAAIVMNRLSTSETY